MIDLGHKRVRCAVLAAGFGIVCTTVSTTSAVAQELAADLPEVDIHCPEAIGNIEISVPCYLHHSRSYEAVRTGATPLSINGGIVVVLYGDNPTELKSVNQDIANMRAKGWPIGLVYAPNGSPYGDGSAVDIIIDRENILPGGDRPPAGFISTQDLVTAIASSYETWRESHK